MHIDYLQLTNFRCFATKTLTFTPQFNVVIGDNGMGKTAVLDALAVGVSTFLLGIDLQSARGIHDNDVRLVTNFSADIPTNDGNYPVRISCKGVINEETVEWQRSLLGNGRRTTQKEATRVKEIAQDLQQRTREQQEVVLPLIVYYDTGRLWFHQQVWVHQQSPTQSEQRDTRLVIVKSAHRSSNGNGETVPPGSRLDGYSKCLRPDNNQDFLHRWFRTQELGALQRGVKNSTLEGIKTTVARAMQRWTRLQYDVQLGDLVAEDADNNRMPIRLLSAGQRNILYMVLDIAYRAATLNPHFGEHASEKTPGVVLIDEIDLHLHPKWQRLIVDDLRTVFPQIQFIATTHSPLIIQSLHQGELIDLDGDSPGDYVNQSPEDIYENVMDIGMPQRSERSIKMIAAAEEYYGLLEKANGANRAPADRINQLKQRLDELMEPFAEDEAYIAFLRQKRAAAGIDKAGIDKD